MEWTTYGHDRTALEALYNNSTYFKERYTYSYDTSWEWASIFTSPTNTVRYNFRSLVGYGLIDNKVSNYIIPINNDVGFIETVTKNNIEIYGFRDATTPSHYLFNTLWQNEEGVYFCLHSGVDYEGTSFCVINASDKNSVVDLSSLISAYNAANTSYGNKYVIQPLVALDKKTGFYLIAGNTTVLEPFTEVQVQDKQFMVVTNGICVEV